MEENAKSVELLFERTTEYVKTSFELIKLKTVAKSSDVVSSIIPHAFVLTLIVSFMLFFNLGLAFFLSEILGEIYYGFFIIAAFYALIGIVIHFFMHDRFKSHVRDWFIKRMLN